MYWDTINVTFQIRREGERREKVSDLTEEKEVEKRERLKGERD